MNLLPRSSALARVVSCGHQPHGAGRRAGRLATLALLVAGLAATVAGPRQALAAGPAQAGRAAEPPTQAAKAEALKRFNRGVELAKEGDARSALVEFRRAYALVPNYRVLYNIGQVTYELQDYVGALRAFDEYLLAGGKDIPKKRRAEVEKEIDKLRPRVATVVVSASVAGAEISVDDAAVGKAPLSSPLLLNPGKRRISAVLEGRKPASKTLDVAGGDSVTLALQLDELKAPEPPPPPPPPSPRPGVPWVAWGITGAFGVGAAVTGILAYRASSELGRQQETLPVSRGELDDTHRRMRRLAIATDVLGGAALVAGAVATYLTLARPGDDDEAPPAGVALSVSPRGVWLAGSF